jgi:hypothetical protein
MSGRESRALRLRDLARAVALAQGQQGVEDGIRVVIYDGPRLRLRFTPGIAGADNPESMEVWKIGERGAAALVLSCYWNAHGLDSILKYLRGSWENALKLLAGLPVLVKRAATAGGTTRPAATA